MSNHKDGERGDWVIRVKIPGEGIFFLGGMIGGPATLTTRKTATIIFRKKRAERVMEKFKSRTRETKMEFKIVRRDKTDRKSK